MQKSRSKKNFLLIGVTTFFQLIISFFYLNFTPLEGSVVRGYGYINDTVFFDSPGFGDLKEVYNFSVDNSDLESPHRQSVAFTQFDKSEHSKYFLNREVNSGSPYFSLIQMELDGNLKFKKIKTILNTTSQPLIHDGRFRLFSAYDPSIAWFRGRYWVAFECWSPDFNKLLTKPTASACMGPLDKNFEMILKETRVVVLGAQDVLLSDPTSPAYSASVPKLLTFEGKMYLYWTSVKINKRDEESLRGRLSALVEKNSLQNHDHYKYLRLKANATYDLLSKNYLKFEDASMAELKQKGVDFSKASDPRNAFYEWQKNVLNGAEHPRKWIYSDGALKATELPASVRFELIETYGSELRFIDTANKPFPVLLNSSEEKNFIALASEFNKFTKVLSTTSHTSQSRVADVQDIKAIDGRIYFTAAIGGNSSISPFHYCITPTTGEGEGGCYRLELFSTDRPLSNIRQSGRTEKLDIRYYMDIFRFASDWEDWERAQPPASHEYARFITAPGGIKLIASFLDKNNPLWTGETGFKKSFSILDVNLKNISTNAINKQPLVGDTSKSSVLLAKQGLISNNQKFSLEVHHSGFDVWSLESGRRLYGVSRQLGKDPRLMLQTDGHFVFYPNFPSQENVWATHKYAKTIKSQINFTDNGNLEHVECNTLCNGNLVWQSPFVRKKLVNGDFMRFGEVLMSENSEYYLEVLNNGFAIRSVNEGLIVFEIKTTAGTVPRFTLQNDGNLVYYPNTGSPNNVWANHKYFLKSTLTVSNTGKLEIKNALGAVVWQSH